MTRNQRYKRAGKQLLVEHVDVREDAPEVRIRAEGLTSLVGELRKDAERMAA